MRSLGLLMTVMIGVAAMGACGDDRIQFGVGGAASGSGSGAQDSECAACKASACAEQRAQCLENEACAALEECMHSCLEISCLESCVGTNRDGVRDYLSLATCTNCESCSDACNDCDMLHCVNEEMDGDEAGVDCGGAACRECDTGGCDSPCDEACHSCAIEQTDQPNGECHPVLAGTDPKDDCPGDDTCTGGGVCGCGDGQLDNAESDVDCGGPDCGGCDSGKVCAGDGDCMSGHCADGVCCNDKCEGECEACVAAKTTVPDGTCAPIPGGSDPDAECTDEGAASCGENGLCDGQAECAKYPAGTACGSSQSCSGGIETKQDTCNGLGSCIDNGTVSCAPFSCGTNSCFVSCSTTSQCDPGYYCDGTACQPLKPLGQACAGATQCLSGHCIEGVCCNSVCNGACMSCKQQHTGQSNGTCAAIAANTDPHNECSVQAASSCGTTGMCSGVGTCQLWPSGTTCGSPPSCSMGTLNLGDACNGSGDCVIGGTASCFPYVCDTLTCFTSCTSNAQCATGRYCEPATTTCNPLKAQGASCTIGTQCASGHCVDGFCCNTACGAACQACSNNKTSAANGTCAAVTANTDPDNDCTNPATDVCNGAGQCKCNDGQKTGDEACTDCGGQYCAACTGTWSCGGCATSAFHGECCDGDCATTCPDEQSACMLLSGSACTAIGDTAFFASGQFGAEATCAPNGCFGYQCQCACN
jgi:hypothetical protein